MAVLMNGFIRDIERNYKLSHDIPDAIIHEIEEFYNLPVIIMNNGSGFIKSGFADDSTPSNIFPSVVGRIRIPSHLLSGFGLKPIYIANDAIAKRGIMNIQHPVQHGIVTNWDDMEQLWRHTVDNELKFDVEGCNILSTEAPLNPKSNREKTTQIMFEKFKVGGFYLAVGEVLALHASGRKTGTVFSSGYAVSHTVPIYEGCCIHHAVRRVDIGGIDTTEYLMKILTERGYSFTTTAEKQIVNDIKEKLCYIASDYDQEMEKYNEWHNVEKMYELPDGQMMMIGSEMFRAPEILFAPHWIAWSTPGCHYQIYKAIDSCKDIKKELYENIVISGGNTMFNGFVNRLQNELKQYVSDNQIINVIAPKERQYSEWIGASMILSISTFQSMWITTKDYEEHGPSIVHRKCTGCP